MGVCAGSIWPYELEANACIRHGSVDEEILACNARFSEVAVHATFPSDMISSQHRYFVGDAFTDCPFGGNPAAVVPLQEWKNDQELQTVAMDETVEKPKL